MRTSRSTPLRRDDWIVEQGRRAGRRGDNANPFPAGSPNHSRWAAGHLETRQAQAQAAPAPVPAPATGAATPVKPRSRPMPASRREPGAPLASLARLAATLCAQAEFQRFCGVSSAEQAAEHIRNVCGVVSRRDLDTDAAAARIFHERFRRPYAASREV